jgi:hypothetical protein
LNAKEQDLLIKHASERMALHAAQAAESRKFSYRLKRAVLRLIARLPALRSVLTPITGNARLNPQQRHVLENEALAGRHADERAMIGRQQRAMAAVEKRELKALKQALRREIIETGGHSPSLMTRPSHEDEYLHLLHERLTERRRRRESGQRLSVTFNLNADPRRKRSEDERRGDIKITWDSKDHPRGT